MSTKVELRSPAELVAIARAGPVVWRPGFGAIREAGTAQVVRDASHVRFATCHARTHWNGGETCPVNPPPSRPGAPAPRSATDHAIGPRPREAAESLGVCERTLRDLPGLPRLKLNGGTVLYPVRELEQWLSDRLERGPEADAPAVPAGVPDSDGDADGLCSLCACERQRCSTCRPPTGCEVSAPPVSRATAPVLGTVPDSSPNRPPSMRAGRSSTTAPPCVTPRASFAEEPTL